MVVNTSVSEHSDTLMRHALALASSRGFEPTTIFLVLQSENRWARCYICRDTGSIGEFVYNYVDAFSMLKEGVDVQLLSPPSWSTPFPEKGFGSASE